jgi:ATP-dependent helicase/nuclease subunit A
MTAPKKKKPAPTPDQRKAADPGHSVWVAASAGSGKTQVLVDRVIRLLLEGAAPDAILCLTFTKAAAAEMSNRLFKRLSEWIGLDDKELTEDLLRLGVAHVDVKTRNTARRLFALALETPGGLKIQTIHAFCERLLQMFPVESGMAPGFRVMEDQETKELFRNALLQSLSSDDDITKSAWSFLDDGSIANLDTLEKLAGPFLSGAMGMRRRLSDTDSFAETKAALAETLGVAEVVDSASLIADICDIDTSDYKSAIAGLMPHEADADHSAPQFLQLALDANTATQRCDILAKLVLTGTGSIRKSILRVKARKSEPELALWLDLERERLLRLLEELAKQQILDANLAIYSAMAGVMVRVNQAKRARGLYDFDDLITRTAQLLKGHEAAQWVLYKLDKGLTHILVDEAQDTSPAQWTIINALAGEFFTGQGDVGVKRTVFAVGDLKQSIYSFQGADIAAFEAARSTFSKTLLEAQDPLQDVDLSVSYRSNQQVLDVVDQVFAPGRKARTGFGPRADYERPHTADAKDRMGLVELWDLITPDAADEHDNWRAPVDRKSNRHPRLKLADRIARTIKSWIGTREVAGQTRMVGAGDILILLQSRNDLFHALLGALRRYGVPVAGADRLKLQDSMIVKDLIMLGHFIRMPSDDHALACILKSPLVPEPVTEEQLFTLAFGRDTQSLLQRLPTESANAIWLRNICVSVATPYMLFAKVLTDKRRLILERLGQEADDAGQEFLSLALDYEQKHGTSLTGFLDWLAQNETEIKREMEADSGLVRLMTVHGAKGLEAPIVFLADAADPPPSSKGRLLKVTETGPWRGLLLFEAKTIMTPAVVDRLKAAAKAENLNERLRLLYVGMTRAADELYICGSLNKEDESKVNADSWYPQIKYAILENSTLKGLRVFTADDGLSITRFGAEPVDGNAPFVKEAVEFALPPWATTALPDRMLKPVLVAPPRNSDAFDRKAVEEGIAIHKLIEMMADIPPHNRLAEALRWAKRLKLASTTAEHLHRLLLLPELSVFFGKDAQSEVSLGSAGGFNGRIDRLMIADGCIYLLDYKTNRHPPNHVGREHPYARQMAGYARLLRQAFPDHDVKAALLWTQTGDVTWISREILSQSYDDGLEATA